MVNASDPFLVQQICRAPMMTYELWYNTTGIPVASDPNLDASAYWGYTCPWQVRSPNCQVCVFLLNGQA